MTAQRALNMLPLLAMVPAVFLGACDTLHGLTFDVNAGEGRAFSDACITSAIQSVGLQVEKESPTQFTVRNAAGYLFFVSRTSKPAGARIYAMSMHEPMPCEALGSMAPGMNEVALAIQRRCDAESIPVKMQLLGRQQTCGLQFR